MALKWDFIVQKRNILNEIRSNNMTLQELRFFSIYLAKINKDKIETRVVRFPLSDFQRIMEYRYLNISQIKNTTDALLCKVVHLALDSGGYDSFQLFKKCKLDRDDSGEWFVEINAHDDALPLMFEFKDKYFSYKLWNALKLKGPNQLRMYEILKQYEKAGERIISLATLRELIGIDKDEYPRWNNFKNRVLNACQKAISENTDIEFTYEPHGRRGPGGKILALKFHISKNPNHIDQLSLDEFIASHDEPEAVLEWNRHDEIIELFSNACNNEFSREQMEILFGLVIKAEPDEIGSLEQEAYLAHKYKELVYRASKSEIRNRFAYLKKIIENDISSF